MTSDDYFNLLNKANGNFSDLNRTQSRLKIPDPDVIYEGKSTIVRNFGDILEMINRPEKSVVKFLSVELGIGITIDGSRMIINRKVSPEIIQDKIKKYMDSFVICYECGSPDTEIQRLGRVEVLVCKACGAQHSIRMDKDLKKTEADIEEGKKYTVTITESGNSGEGKAIYKGYTILVPGAKKGETVTVLIRKIRRKVAVSEIVK
ncbi:MAG: translation initiation factor IF-2 subunit beta [Candidatus Thermoplasmatota archaeon]|jgi:translation initiation factor 2 subunit 2|nr:translation initiation factor IF-2 subunit beta [Candidatus Thermoplasmatota archaeon]MCL5665531.1 translation initiation factor IF-2 subunit beta [Candidatus Thermoplasmatota archaeon]